MPDRVATSRKPKAKANPANVVRLLLVLLLSAAAFIQFTTVTQTVVRYPLRAEAGDNFSTAWNLHQFGVYSKAPVWERPPPRLAPRPDAALPPGYPVFLLAAGAPSPHADWGLKVQFLQAALGVLTVLLCFLLGRRVAGPGWGLAAGALAVLEPQMATSNAYLLTPVLFTFLLLLAVWTSLRALDARGPAWFLPAGLAWGIAALVQSPALWPVPVFLVVAWLWPRCRQWRSGATIAFVAFALMVGPWMLREAMTPDAPVATPVAGETAPQAAPPTAPAHRFGNPAALLGQDDVAGRGLFLEEVDKSPFLASPVFRGLAGVGGALHWPIVVLAFAALVLLAARPGALRLSSTAVKGAWVFAGLLVLGLARALILPPTSGDAIAYRPILFVLALVALRAAFLAVRSPPQRANDAPNS